MENLLTPGFGEIVGAVVDGVGMIVIVVLMLRGDVLPRSIVDRILEEAEKRSKITAQEILDCMESKIKGAVKEGVLEGHAEARKTPAGD